MIPYLVMGIVLTAATVILVWFAVSALIQLKKTLLNVDTLVINMNEQLNPLLDDLHDAVKKVNNEMDRYEDVVGTVKDIGDKVSAVTRVVHEIVSSPLLKVASISAGAKDVITAGAKEVIKKMVKR